ncbi:DNA polymerase IV [Ruminococcus sp. zg-921]|uniref:DNA polymerase IV n=1 Tax=Ruminococcus sp. zg-921 TaxID=2678506 RepID=UPI002109727F|nr:DNA polymerase IV [Ruminococcus sp. zg-921]MCQ4115138.1 DNA polymerase IV [Ruminococcus sp. zg-921]
MERTILHSDCNSFYASVECALHPELKDKPVAVCGDSDLRHGIILTKNEVAKKFKIKTGEAIWQARQKCPSLVLVKANFSTYLEFSRRVKKIYLDYTDNVESFGIDEAWLDVTGSQMLFGDGECIAREINRRVREELGITVSIGVSFNKIFAKLGSDYKKPDAITVISRKNFRDILYPLPANDLLYVGCATTRKLKQLGINTIGQLASADRRTLTQTLGIWGERLQSYALGLDKSPVSKYYENRNVKSIGNSTTAVRDLKTLSDIKIVFSTLCDSVSRRLREQNLRCSVVSISVRNNKLSSFEVQHKLLTPTNITRDIFETALMLFKSSYKLERPVRSLGISVNGLIPECDGVQLNVFDQGDKRRLEQLDIATDKLKQRYGSFAVLPAIALENKRLSSFDPIADHVIHPVGFAIS